MVNRIIGEYLQSNKRLIVPEFGAFIKKDNEGNIVFVPFLKKDDGVLTEKLSARYGLTAAEAKAVIDDYIFNIRKAIDANGFFAIDNLGRLKMDGNNIYYLDYNASERGDGKVKPEASMSGSPNSASGQASETAKTQPQQQTQQSQSAQQQYNQSQARQTIEQDVKDNLSVSRAPLVNSAGQETFASQSKTADEQRVESAYRQPQPQSQRPVQTQQQHVAMRDRQMHHQSGLQRTTSQGQQIRQPGPQSRRPNQPRPGQRKPRQTSSKMDKIIIVAILAAAIAMAVIIFSVVTNLGEPRKVKVELAPATEQTASATAAKPEGTPAVVAQPAN